MKERQLRIEPIGTILRLPFLHYGNNMNMTAVHRLIEKQISWRSIQDRRRLYVQGDIDYCIVSLLFTRKLEQKKADGVD